MQKKIIVTFIIGLLIVIGVTCYVDRKIIIINEERAEEVTSECLVEGELDEIKLDNPRGMYSKEFYISCEIEKKGEIYYTFDCESPIPESDSTYKYIEPIKISAEEENKTLVLKLKAVYDDQTESEVYTHTYLVGTNIENRYDCLILSVSGEPDDLYGYENGIFVSGKLWDDFWEENPDSDIMVAKAPANYWLKGEEGERHVSVEFFRSNGESLISQNAGLRINGGLSRMDQQKSFQLYARKEYGQQNRFNYPFFTTEKYSNSDKVVEEYKRLLVRTPRVYDHFMRDVVAANLVEQTGFSDILASCQVALYINGEYQGVHWIRNVFCNTYFENKYGDFEGEFIILENSEIYKETTDEETKDYAEEYNALYEKFSKENLTQDDIYAELNNFIDVNNYLEYMAIENYFINGDWPYNNLKVYRYVAENNAYEENTVFDGRYRFLLFDFDLTFITSVGGGFLLPNMDTYVPLFSALMKREESKNYFVNYTCDLLNTALLSNNVKEKVELLKNESINEIRETIKEFSLSSELEEFDRLPIVFAEGREEIVREQLDEIFELGGDYFLKITIPEECALLCNSHMKLYAGEYEGYYMQKVPVSLRTMVKLGLKTSYWLVNEELYYGEELIITEEMIVDGYVNVELVIEDNPEADLTISHIQSKGADDYIILTNTSLHAIKTTGYFLSDDTDNLQKYMMPAMTVGAGESIVLYGKNYSNMDSLGKLGLNFSLKEGENLTLSKGKDNIIEQIIIPDLDEGQIYEKDLIIGTYKKTSTD